MYKSCDVEQIKVLTPNCIMLACRRGESSWSFIFQQNDSMRAMLTSVFLALALLHPCLADMYLHFPPGSNNRLNGAQANVRNANRLFDSQVRRNL